MIIMIITIIINKIGFNIYIYIHINDNNDVCMFPMEKSLKFMNDP